MSLINIIGKQKRGVIVLSIKVKNIKYYDVCKECEFLYHCYGREIAERIQNDQTVLRYRNSDVDKNLSLTLAMVHKPLFGVSN